MGSPVPGDGACLVRLGRHQEGTKVGNCRRMSLNLHTFPAKSTLRMIMGDFHSLSPGIAGCRRLSLLTGAMPIGWV